MKLQNKFIRKIVVVLLFGLLGFAEASFAQETAPPQTNREQVAQNFTDVELKQFIDASERIMVLQQENEQAMLAILEEEKMDVNKFNELAIAYQEERMEEAAATEAEKQAFDKVAKRIVEMQPAVQAKVQQAIEKDGMTLQKYEKIMLAYQEDPAVQAKVQSMIAESEK